MTVPILPRLNGPADLRGLTDAQLAELAAEIRETIIGTVAKTGGHLGSSLGVVEIAIALHRLLESPRDRIVWDTGHQAYAHKLLTGRLERFDTLRQIDGVGGFPRRSESQHDVFDGGHAGTGLSIAEGLAAARDIRRQQRAHRGGRRRRGADDRAVARGAQRHRPSADADAHRPQRQRDVDQQDGRGVLDVPLEDQADAAPGSRASRSTTELVGKIPVVGPAAVMWSQRLRRSVVNLASPGQLFEDLGITYIGVIPGHDIHALLQTFERVFELKGPTIVHVRTQKGRGYKPAEKDQVSFHGAALPPMELAPLTDAFDGTGRRARCRGLGGLRAAPPAPRSDRGARTAPARTATHSPRRRRRAPAASRRATRRCSCPS